MIRRVLSVGFYIVAGLLFYTVSVVAFIDVAALGASPATSDASDASFPKWLPMTIFTVPAVLTLVVGLAIMGFQEWKRDAGIVLLSAAGFTTFLVFMVATMLMKEDSRKVLPPEMLSFFGDYITGAAVIVGLALGGALLLIMSRKPRAMA
jgi:uncharacterized membrane protein YozB (DUF420 family)